MSPDFSVAMTAEVEGVLAGHLLRPDHQEDICLATFAMSTGATRETAIVREVHLPGQGERLVHGNATITGAYVLRVARLAAEQGLGIVMLHSHPGGSGWQGLSREDDEAESFYHELARVITGYPLIGMTLAGADHGWSARRWARGSRQDAISVRVIGKTLRMSFNERLRPPQASRPRQRRTIDSWGAAVQADVARMRILVVGAGSVGLDVAARLAATGVRDLTIVDPDVVKPHNLDRMIGASPVDAVVGTPKVDVARRLTKRASTARHATITSVALDLASREGERVALDHDIILCCVDRPLPRAVLNQIAYADLIPVIDGGIAIDTFEDGRMRNATWRAHVIRPGRPCLYCNKQVSITQVARDRDGTLDDPRYIAGAAAEQPGSQNVAVLAASVSAAQLALFTSMVAAPGGLGEPGPLQYSLSTHRLEVRPDVSAPYCQLEKRVGVGDRRVLLTREATVFDRHGTRVLRSPFVRVALGLIDRASRRLDSHAASLIDREGRRSV